MKKRTRPTRLIGLAGLFSSLFFVLLVITLLCFINSCVYQTDTNVSQEKKIADDSDNITDFVIVIDGNGSKETMIVLNQTIILAKNQSANNKTTEEAEDDEEFQEENEPGLRSAVEFYFLLRGKSYIRHILREGEQGTYNMSGILVSIKPLIIASDEAKFRINNYTTKTLAEDDSDTAGDFEIIVKDIYYRQ